MASGYDELAKRHGFSREAVEAMAQALTLGHGRAAQFNHPEFGGMGQWMPGMVMIGDAFNHALKARVEQLCLDLSGQYKPSPAFTMSPMPSMQSWWPADYGQPSMSGQQNEARYAYFPALNRLLIMRNTTLYVYATGDHHLTGVAQQQSNNSQVLVFRTDRGHPVREDDLDRLS